MKKLVLALPLILLTACQQQNPPTKLGDYYHANLTLIDDGCSLLVQDPYMEDHLNPPFKVYLAKPECSDTYTRAIDGHK